MDNSPEIRRIAKELVEKIKNRVDQITLFDENGKDVYDEKTARSIKFDYISKDKDNFGSVVVSIIDDADEKKSLKVLFSRNLSADLTNEQTTEWYGFLRDLRMFAKRNLLKFTPIDISRGGFTQKEDPHKATRESINPVTEAKLYGSSKTSYKTIAPGTKLIIRHSSNIDETKHGARSRKIDSVYIEDIDGQRFKCPFNKLTACEALARHIEQGGKIHDEFSSHITELAEEMSKLKRFVQGTRNKTYEDAEANEVASTAKDRYHQVHSMLHKLKGARGYKFYKESWKPSKTLTDDINLEELKMRFIQKNFDERLEDGLPFAYRAHRNSKEPIVEFEEWVDKVTDNVWALPDDELAIKKLQELMSEVWEAGINGLNAIGTLQGIITRDDASDLYKKIEQAADASEEVDVRPIVFKWLTNNIPEVADRIESNMQQSPTEEEPAAEEPPAQEEPAEEPAEPQAAAQEEPAEEPAAEQPAEEYDQSKEQPAESIKRTGKVINEYYSVESDNAPYYLLKTKVLESAKQQVAKSKQNGVTATIYNVKIIEGRKYKTNISTPVITESKNTTLLDIKRLAGLK